MKISTAIIALSFSCANAFAPSAVRSTTMQRQMFSGAGEAAPKEDDEGKLAEMAEGLERGRGVLLMQQVLLLRNSDKIKGGGVLRPCEVRN